jgi:hypothetical protein
MKLGMTVQTAINFAYSFDDHALSKYRPENNKTTNAVTNFVSQVSSDIQKIYSTAQTKQ